MQKKVCLVGSSAVGKTSLVARFVRSMFSEKYLTTVGVKIDKKTVTAGARGVTLVLWDLNGDDEFQRLQMSYLRGAAGYLLVVDGCRRTTLDRAFDLHRRVVETVGEVPFVLAVNKADLCADWELDETVFADLGRRNWVVLHTSAKTGQNVEEAFLRLTQMMLS